jgi:uncharacterized membrane protein
MEDEIIVAVFPSRAILTKALDRVMELDYLKVKYAAIVARANSGEVVVLDDDISPNEGGLAGGTLGAAMTAFGLVQLGALALPGIGPIIALGSGLVAGGLVGGLTGRLAAAVLDFDYKDYQVRALADQLQAGHPALVLQIEDAAGVLHQLRADLRPYRAELVELLRDAPFLVGREAGPAQVDS